MKSKKTLLIPILLFSFLVSSCTMIVADDTEGEEGQIHETTYYNVTFVNYDSTFLYSCKVEENGYATYNASAPTRPSDGAYVYTFNGWDKPLTTAITADTTFTATYTSRIIESYNVTFVNYDGEVLYETIVHEYEEAVYVGPTPTRPTGDDGTTYTFSGWNKDTSVITSDTIFTAVYYAKKAQFKVAFYNYDDSLLDSQYVYYGDGVSYQGPTPTRPENGATVYTFAGWDQDLTEVTENMDVHAMYSESKRQVKVTYVDYDGSFLSQQIIDYGSSCTYEGSDPYRKPEGRYQFAFTGWSVDTSVVYSDTQVVAQYQRSDREGTNGLQYSFDNTTFTYKVTGYNGSDEEVFIPKQYNGGNGNFPVTSIENQAFMGRTFITSVFIEDNVTSMGYEVFVDCYDLETIRLSDNLVSIGDNAFSSCRSLKKLELPKGIQSINKNTLGGLSKNVDITIDSQNPYYFIKDNVVYSKDKTVLYFGIPGAVKDEVVLPDETLTITAEAFRGASFSSITFNEGLTKIGTYAFYQVSNLKKIELSLTVQTIESYAFQDADSINEVVLSENITTIGEYAFQDCNGLNKVTMNEGTNSVSIGNYAFNNCSNLKTFVMSNNVVYIGEWCFGYCYALEECNISTSLTSMGNLAFYSCNNLKTIEIPGTLKTIPYAAFQHCYIENITINEGVERIESQAFYNTSIKSLVIPSSVQFIGYNAFGCCYSMTSLTLPSNSYVDWLEDNVFSNNNSLTEVNFEGELVDLGRYTFYWCQNLRSITLPEGLKELDDGILFYCSSLEYLSIPSTLKTISDNALGYCNNLKEIDVAEGNKYFVSNDKGLFTANGKKLIKAFVTDSSYEVPNTVTDIGDYAFSNNQVLNSISLPNSLTRIGNEAFRNCDNLRSISIPNSVTEIGSSAFSEISYLTSITLPASITEISSGLLSSCENLTEIDIPNNVVRINDSAFSNCQSLKKVVIPNSVTYIGSSAFYYCEKMNSVTLPIELVTIESNAFYYCPALTSIELPDKLEYIGYSAFQECSSLKEIELPDSLVTLYGSAFAHCTSLTSMTLPGSIRNMDGEIFYNCTSLESVVFEEGIESVTSYMFSQCTSLKEVKLCSTIKYINYYAFNQCTSLESIYIPNGVRRISNEAFAYCSALTTVYIPVSLNEQCYSGIFYNCYNLTTIYFLGVGNPMIIWDTYWITNIDGNYYSYSIYAYYYYTENPTEDQCKSGYYWHYDEDGNVVIWTYEELEDPNQQQSE